MEEAVIQLPEQLLYETLDYYHNIRYIDNASCEGRSPESWQCIHVTHIVGVSSTFKPIAYVTSEAGAVPLTLTQILAASIAAAATVILHKHKDKRLEWTQCYMLTDDWNEKPYNIFHFCENHLYESESS